MVLKGDTTDADWVGVLGISYDEYVAPIVEQREQPGFNIDRDRPELFRNAFLKATKDGITEETLAEFYSGDVLPRIAASEMPRDGLLQWLIDKGLGAGPPLIEAVAEETGGHFTFLSHGCGDGSVGMGVAMQYPKSHVFLYDYWTPPREVLRRAILRYVDNWYIRVSLIERGFNHRFYEHMQLDYVSSKDVLEHVLDPLAEVRALARALRPGGIAHLCTYFNSDHGRDPSHLQRHECFVAQPEAWLRGVQDCGLELIGECARGKTIFRRTGGAADG